MKVKTAKQDICLSVSGMNLFDTCPNKYKENRITKTAEVIDYGISAILGTVAHNLTQKAIGEQYLQNGAVEHITEEEFKEEFVRILPVKFYGMYGSNIYGDITGEQITHIENEYDANLEDTDKTLRELFFEWRDRVVTSSTFKGDTDKMFTAWTKTTNNMIDGIVNICIENGVVEIEIEKRTYSKANGVRDTSKLKLGFVYVTDLILHTVDNKIVVIELKTSSKTVKTVQPTNVEQILFYKYNLRKEYGKNKKIKYFIMYGCTLKTKQECHILDLTNFEQQNYERLLKEKVEMIKFAYTKNIFPTRFSLACSYCNVSTCVGYAKDSEEE